MIRMKTVSTRKKMIGVITAMFAMLSVLILHSCAAASRLSEQTGAELWANNCARCHNLPSPATYSSAEWEVINLHMKTRALITELEMSKIQLFLKESSR